MVCVCVRKEENGKRSEGGERKKKEREGGQGTSNGQPHLSTREQAYFVLSLPSLTSR